VATDAHLDDEVGGSGLAWIAANSIESDALPTDLADEHDHYLYGRPKKDSGVKELT
jgi:hypothetical protein